MLSVVNAEVPPRVEYDLTELGHTLIEPIAALTRWAETNGAAILDALESAEHIARQRDETMPAPTAQRPNDSPHQDPIHRS
jgi:DNA-binding HxlR family transcriptional regulator